MKKLLTIIMAAVGVAAYGNADPATCGVNGGDGSIVAKGDIFLIDDPSNIDYVETLEPGANILRGAIATVVSGDVSREEGSTDLGMLTDGVLVYDDTVSSRNSGAANVVTFYPDATIGWSWPSDEPRTLNELRIFSSWSGGPDRNDIVIDCLSVQKPDGTWTDLCEKGEYPCAIGFAIPKQYSTVYRDGELQTGERPSRMLRIFSGDDDDILADGIIGIRIVFGYQDHGYGGCCEIEARGSMTKTTMGPVEIAGGASKVEYSDEGDVHRYVFSAPATVYATDAVTIQEVGSLLKGETYRVDVPNGETKTLLITSGYSIKATAIVYPAGMRPALVRKNALRGLTASVIAGGLGPDCVNDLNVLTDGVIPFRNESVSQTAVSLLANTTLEWTWDDPKYIDTIRVFANWGGGPYRNDLIVRRIETRDSEGNWNIVGAKANGLGFMPYFGYSRQRDMTTFFNADGNIDFGGRDSRLITMSSADGQCIAASVTGLRLALGYQNMQYGGLVEVEAVGSEPLTDLDKGRFIEFDCDYTGEEVFENFPVLIRLNEDTIAGFDYRLAEPDKLRFRIGSEIVPHEVDTWDPLGTSTVWVKVPRLSKDTVITMFYGSTTDRKPVADGSIWDDYTGVWHMTDGVDSTDNDLDAEIGLYSRQVSDGCIGTAYQITDGAYSTFKVNLHADTDKLAVVKELGNDFTVALWMRTPNIAAWQWLISRCQTEGGRGWGLHLESPNEGYNKWQIWTGLGNPSSFETDNVTDYMTDPCGLNQWCHIVLVYSTQAFRIYRDGELVYENTSVAGLFDNDYDSDLFIGGCGNAYAYNGQLDEVRISKGTPSDALVAIDYANQSEGIFTAGRAQIIPNGLFFIIR